MPAKAYDSAHSLEDVKHLCLQNFMDTNLMQLLHDPAMEELFYNVFQLGYLVSKQGDRLDSLYV